MNYTCFIAVSRKYPWHVLLGFGLLTYVLFLDRAVSGVTSHDMFERNVASKNTSCRRPCPFRRNVIILDHLFPAGLNDRTLMFQIMTNLAGYLCATVYVPPPWTMLSIAHNRRINIAKNLAWNDFYNFTFRDDHAMALLQYEPANQDLSKSFNFSKMALFRPPKNQKDPFIRFALREPTDFGPQMQQLDRFVTRQQSNGRPNDDTPAFLWEIYLPTYAFAKEREAWIKTKSHDHDPPAILANPEHGCSYTMQQDSSLSHEIADYVFDRIRILHPVTTKSMVLLHVRRTDGLDACNTSLAAMHQYLSCSFAERNMIASQFGPITVLFASDERDPCYRSAIQEMVTQGLGYDFVDLDATIEETIYSYSLHIPDGYRLRNNNLYVFHVYNVMAQDPRIQIILEKRRQLMCPDCTDIMDTLANVTVPDPSSSIRRTRSPERTTKRSGWNLSKILNNYERCTNTILEKSATIKPTMNRSGRVPRHESHRS